MSDNKHPGSPDSTCYLPIDSKCSDIMLSSVYAKSHYRYYLPYGRLYVEQHPGKPMINQINQMAGTKLTTIRFIEINRAQSYYKQFLNIPGNPDNSCKDMQKRRIGNTLCILPFPVQKETQSKAAADTGL